MIEAELNIREKPSIEDAPEVTKKETGVFVTLNKYNYKGNPLRGCIGIPYPVKPLIDALEESAHNAAFEDPRFPPVQKEEMSKIVVEVSVLTPPQKIKAGNPQDYPDKIKVGKDGLIISRGHRRGLLLPQVPLDWGWDSEEFLNHTCIKAGLPPDSWLMSDTEVYSFQAIIFAEKAPRGYIQRHKL